MADFKSEWQKYFNNIIGTKSDVVGTYNGKPVYSIPTGLSTITTKRENGDYYLKSDGSIGTWKNAEQGNNILGSIASVASGGLTDVLQGEAPLSGAGTVVQSVLNPLSVSIPGAIEGIKNGDYSSALQYLVDPITEPGIDSLARGSGDVIESAVPGISPYYRTLGSLVGTVVAPGWGTLAGYEVGNKMAGGTADQALKGGAIIGATSAAGSYLNELLSPAISSTSPAYEAAAINGPGSVANSAGLGSYILDPSLAADITGNVSSSLADLSSLSSAAGVSSVLPLGEVSSLAPTGATNTLEDLMTNAVEGINKTPQITPDPTLSAPIEQVAPMTTPSPEFSTTMMPDTSPTSMADIVEGGKDIARTGLKGYSAYNKGKQLYNLFNQGNSGTPQQQAQYQAPTTNTSTINVPVGATPTLGDLMNKKNSAFGAVLV